MKRVWHRVSVLSRLLTAAVMASLYLFGVYVGQQYAAALPPAPALVYFSTVKEVSLLMAPVVLRAATSTFAGKATTTSAVASKVSLALAPPAPKPTPPSTAVPHAAATTSAPVITPAPVQIASLPPVVTPPAVSTPATQPATTSATTTPPKPPAPAPAPPATSTPSTGESRFTAYTTGYGWPDNTPPGGALSDGVLHQTAGGTGTYQDPITVAVGHSISGGTDTLDYPKGTKFYVPNLRRYFIVEDTCGDGNSPQNGPCHTGYQGHVWLDLWIGGTTATKSATLTCEDDITGLFLVIENPASTYAVIPGPVFGAVCSAQFGDAVLAQ